MPTSIKDISFVAGLLEGEGCFYISNQKSLASGSIAMVSCDRDTIDKFKQIVKTPNFIQSTKRYGNWNTSYKVTVTGKLAIQWMMTIYPFMSIRRKARILQLLNRWKLSLGSGAPGKTRKIG